MKVLLTFMSVALLSSASFAQMPTQPNRPAGAPTPAQTNSPTEGMPAPRTTPAQANSPAEGKTVAQRHGKPQAKTKEEFADYQAAVAIPDPTAELEAAGKFAEKYPQSELRYVLYSQLLQKFYGANDSSKVVDTGRKVLAIEPEDALAKVVIATALAESTHDTDLDQDEKYTEAMKDAESAIKTMDTGLITPPQATPEQIASVKHQLLAWAHAAMGYIELTRKNYALSEQHFKEAIAANPEQPDSTNFLRLAVAQDNLAHYPDAMTNADKALQLAQTENNAQIVGLAKNEKDRLTKLMASAPKSTTPPPPKQ
jgi:tetratricopeptide (TPR) repeat protein